MLFFLSELGPDTFLRLFQYITVRTLGASATSFIIMYFITPRCIKILKKINFSEQDTDKRLNDSVKKEKLGTPIMGGLIIIIATLLSTLMWAIPTNIYVQLTLGTLIIMGLIGFIDDYLKIKNKNGLSVKFKFLALIGWTLIIFIYLWNNPDTHQRVRELMVPFFKEPILIMGFFTAFIFMSLVMVGASNAVNLADGLDGLAIGCTNSVIAAYLILTYIAGHYNFSEYLQVPFVQGSGELTVFCGSLLGSGLGFLWYNCHPAKVFMGDTGSLALGGSIAAVAIFIKQELLLVIVGFVFVIEAISVILQVGFFKYSRMMHGNGRRIFKCAPLHHHFEKLGERESVIVVRFWITGIIFALIGIATLKIR